MHVSSIHVLERIALLIFLSHFLSIRRRSPGRKTIRSEFSRMHMSSLRVRERMALLSFLSHLLSISVKARYGLAELPELALELRKTSSRLVRSWASM